MNLPLKKRIDSCIQNCRIPILVFTVLLLGPGVLADNDTCMECHGDAKLTMKVGEKAKSLFVDLERFENSIHGDSECLDCHEDAEETEDGHHIDELAAVDCSMCHDDVFESYESSIHGQLGADGNLNASCAGCHNTHSILESSDPESATYFFNIPSTCARCHREGEKAAAAYEGNETHIIENYSMSIHGKGLLKSGLNVTANCVSCHGSHEIHPAENEESTVHSDNIAELCATCHVGILAQFETSIHSPKVNDTDKKLPKCNDCHTSHAINRTSTTGFGAKTMDQCGKCHEEVAHLYFESFHGKASKLGLEEAAKCYDCHGAHTILPADMPDSSLSEQNIVNTCAKCHDNSNAKFTNYISHADHNDRENYPILFYSFWFMTLLLLGTFSFFGIHTLLWFRKAWSEHRKQGKHVKVGSTELKQVRRFDAFSRSLHLMVILSFISLAVTGMTLKFAHVPVFQFISRMIGGFEVSGVIHRLAAIVTFLYFVLHVGYLVSKRTVRGVSWKSFFVGERTLVPRWQDLIEFLQTMKWFFNLGPRPNYGRWTYWEKFDYFAVFWGVTIIGSTGVVLWFPEFCTMLGLPGSWINVATIVHSDEALLATGFIFTIHFFNTHFRPEKFPMDPVIFTGSMSLDEFKEERPREYELAVQDGTLDDLLVDPPSKAFLRMAKIFGLTCLTIGVLTVILIIYSLF